MKKNFPSAILLILLIACSSKPNYEPASYYHPHQLDSLKTSIITYLFEAPPYTSMRDRFDREHWEFYSTTASRFELKKLYKTDDGKHFFYVVRPSPYPDKKRGVGGYFFVDDKFKLNGFREVFVTPILPEADVKGRCEIMFDEMVNGGLEKYFSMKTYVQWPNEVSYYDTTTYEWKLKPGAIE